MENRYYKYSYELHLHTSLSSSAARPTPDEIVSLYTRAGYTGVFVTDHLPGRGSSADPALPFAEQIEIFLSGYRAVCRAAKDSELRVFFGAEYSYHGTDFLLYGLPPEWYLTHPELLSLPLADALRFARSSGAAVVQAHPMRQAEGIEYMRLLPNDVDAVEIHNCSSAEFANQVAERYAKCYNLPGVCGSAITGVDSPTLAKFITRGPMNTERDLLAYLTCGRYRTKIVRNPTLLEGGSYDYPPFLNRI